MGFLKKIISELKDPKVPASTKLGVISSLFTIFGFSAVAAFTTLITQAAIEVLIISTLVGIMYAWIFFGITKLLKKFLYSFFDNSFGGILYVLVQILAILMLIYFLSLVFQWFSQLANLLDI
ncbi:hypothetical protein D5E69_14640 [Rossellomorea marisflavi]|uniref:hypothetical protein n=1 Tax=Rossellomorea marisflavi TaxID=189381 RepID=UPI0013170269|nr:hypothetical protein [Rossellomorea marisflavi]QHA36928.1 hypothetical protein D5E69_14640 [Rossellomorea marisflavi]